jgi:negative regulator of flagellin synthesis FlgM
VKIDTTLKTMAAPRAKEAKTERPAASPARREAEGVSDSVRLTATSGRLRQMEGELADIEVADAAKIESVREAIADGSFAVDEEAVAEGMIQETIDTLRTRS